MINRIRWRLSMAISHLGWWVMPEPQRSRCYQDFQATINEIRAREG